MKSNRNQICGASTRSGGFTLIEIALSMLLLGVILVGAMQVYTIYQINSRSTKTLEAVSGLATALSQYKNANGRYPCPAPLREPKDTSPNYGHETDCADPNIGTASVVAPGECLIGATGPDNYNGICVEQSTRTIAGVQPRVRVGAIPFRDLQIDEKDTIDGYGSRIVYAVTESMAVAATYKDSEAAIELQDGAGNILSNGDRSVAFMVISPGKNRNGAVTISGSSLPCVATDMDGANCRDFASTTNTQAIYVMAAQASGTNKFDDIIEYFVPTESEVWRRESQTSENIIDLSEDMVGVGITTPAELTDDLTIRQSTVYKDGNMSNMRSLSATNSLGGYNQSGALRVGKYQSGTHSGKILADRYCTEDGSSCFETNRITGAYDNNPTTGTSGMGCPAGQYMIGIEAERAKCAPIRIACAAGTVFTGTDSNGGPICATPLASCPTQTTTLCSVSYNLAAAGHGVIAPQLNFNLNGACAYSNYRCNQGTWERLAGSSYDTPAACSYVSSTPPTGSTTPSCGGGYTGTYTQNYYTNCWGGVVNTTNTASADCTCVGVSDYVYCSADFGSVVVGTKQRVCTSNVLDAGYSVFTDLFGTTYASEAALLAARCSCSKTEGWEFYSCGSGQVRTASPSPASFTSPVASWPGSGEGQYRKRTVTMSTCTYNYTGWDSSNCVCATGYNTRLINPTCTSCQEVDTQGTVRQIRSGAGCGWIDDPDTSANTPGTCKPRNFIWKNSGVSAGPSNPLAEGRGVSPLCGSTCACGESGSQAACAQSTASQWTYFSATCQLQ